MKAPKQSNEKQDKALLKEQKKAEKLEAKQLKKELRAEKKAQPKDKGQIVKIITTVVLVLLSVAALVGVIYLQMKPKEEIQQQDGNAIHEEDIAIKNAKLSNISLCRKVTELPFIATDLPSVFYTVDAVGNVNFYTWDAEKKEFVQTEPTGTMDFQLTLSGQKIQVKIPYMEKDGVLTGYGLYTEDQKQENVFIYNFIMFKVQNLPSAYQKENKCLLLMHTDSTKAYFQNPTWEQGFILDRKTGATEDFLNDRSQMLGQDGGIRRLQYRINAAALTTAGNQILFASSRGQEAGADGIYPIDLYEKKGKDDVLLLSNIMDDYVKPLGDGKFAFLRKTTDGMTTNLYENGQETPIKTFVSKEYTDAFRRNGDYILDTETGTISTTYNDHTIETKGYRMNPQEFMVGPNEKYIAMFGTSANVFDYYIYIYNTEAKKFTSFKDENYAPHYNLHFIDENTISYYAVHVDGYENVVLDLSSVK